VIPTNNGQACVFAGGTPARIGRGGIAVIEEIIAERAPHIAERLQLATPPTGTRSWAGVPGYMRQPNGPGWALVGDAGYFKDPVSAHGITDALRDAELLARAVVSGWRDQSALDGALEGFAATRDRLSIELFDIVDRIASNAWDAAEISDLLIRLSAALNDEVVQLAALDQELVA
jgi:flavin-dependent dehydrogenase